MAQVIVSGQYDWKLVALSILIAICASYAAFELAGRTATARGRSRKLWLGGGAFTLGLGIWTMHYIGMLAFRLPVPVYYDVPTVAFSLLAAGVASLAALSIVSRDKLSTAALIKGTFAVSGGIATMHYTGMMAMRLDAHATYNSKLFVLSIVIAVVVSFAGLHLAFRFRDPTRNPTWMRLLSAVVMGLAIVTMHYCGMAAVCFHKAVSAENFSHSVSVSSLGELVIAATTLSVLGLSVTGVLVDRYFSFQRSLLQSEQDRWQLVINANQDGLFDADLVSGHVFFSPRWKAILGYGPDELQNADQAWTSGIHPDDKQRVQEMLDAYLSAQHGVYRVEYRMRHRDGTWRWILANALALWDPEGKPIRLVGSHSDITERKQALDELKASEARFSAFMQNTPYLAFIKTADGRFTFANQALENLWGLGPGKSLGSAEIDYFPPDVARKIRQIDLSVLASDRPLEYVVSAPTPDGVFRHFLATSFPLGEVSGQKMLGGVATDITERMKSEEKLRASSSRYRELFERNPLPSWTYALDSLKILDVNESAIDHYGWPREQFVGLSLSVIQPFDQAEDLQTQIEESARLHQPTRPICHRRNNRPDIWVEISSHKIENLVRLVMANDVSARIAAENQSRRAQEQLEALVLQRTAELNTSEAKWRNLVEALPQFVWSVRSDGVCDYISNQWLEYTGVSREETLGFGWLDSIHPADQARVVQKWKVVLAALENYKIEYRIRARDGAYRWFMARGRPVHNDEGAVSHWLGTCTDIDDQKRSEERLESAVAERTVALAEARDRAESAAQAKSSFLAAMSHEIRTPMNGVIGMAGLLASTPLNSQQLGYLDSIRSSGAALLNIINDILDFSKIDAGKMELEQLEFDLQTLLEESLELTAVAAAARSLQISMDVQPNVPFTATGDPGRLRQILLNLLSNAVKFTEHGSISLSVSLQPTQDESLTLHFRVQDTGIGMTAAQQDGLFQAFTQADRSTTRRFGGTGLGLSIAKRLVEIMGGVIGVQSQAGDGTTFWFTIPLLAGTSLQSGDLSNRSILLLDDDLQSRLVIRRYLERAAIHVFGVNRPADAAISLIVIEGATLHRQSDTEWFKSMLLAGCPILVLGSPSDWGGVSLAPTLTATTSYLAKPIRSVPLFEAIQSALGFHDAALSISLLSASQALAMKHQQVDLQGTEILLVEDNLTNQTIAVALLKNLGCRVELAVNGIEACNALERRSFDLIFMDCQMPQMDGFEATRIIRAREHGRRTPIIALTAGVLQEEREQCFAAGMDDFLSKPMPTGQLEATLQKWLALREPLIPEQQPA